MGKLKLVLALLAVGGVLWAIGLATPVIVYPSGATVAELRFLETFAGGYANYVGFKGPGTLSADTVWTLPSTDGAASSVLQTDGAAGLSLAPVGPNSVTTSLKTGQFSYTFFDLDADLPDTLDIPSVIPNVVRNITIQSVYCEIDAGSSTMNVQKNDGTPTNMLSSNLSCSVSGALSTSFVVGENAIASSNHINHVTVTISGVRRMNVTLEYTVSP